MLISLNDLIQFKECPLRYQMIKKHGKKKKKMSLHDAFNQAMDATLLYYYSRLVDYKQLSEKMLIKKFEQLYDELIEKNEIMIDYEHYLVQSKREGKDALSFFSKQQFFYPDDVIKLYIPYIFHVPQTSVSIEGRLFLIRDCPRGHELVSFVNFKDRNSFILYDLDLQMTIDEWAYEKMKGKKADSICIQNMRTGNAYFTERNEIDRKRLINLVKAFEYAQKNNGYYPIESYHCMYCQYQKECRSGGMLL